MEQALELFDSERGLKRSAPRWLKDMFIYHLCNLGELDQALKMVKDRVAMGETNISPSMWYYFFDHACSDLHVSLNQIGYPFDCARLTNTSSPNHYSISGANVSSTNTSTRPPVNAFKH